MRKNLFSMKNSKSYENLNYQNNPVKHERNSISIDRNKQNSLSRSSSEFIIESIDVNPRQYSDRGAKLRQNSRFHGDNYFSTNSADIYGTRPKWNDDYQSRNRDLHSELDRHERWIERFGEEIEDLRIRSNKSERKYGRLQQDFDDCKVKLNHSQRRNSQLESANYFKSQIGTNQCANCAESTRQLQNQKSRVKKKIEELAKDFQLKMENSKSSIEKLKSELNKSVNKCKSLQNENDSNKSQFSGQIGKLELTIKEINEERQILQSNYNKSGEENEHLKFQCDKYLAEINKLESVLKESDRTNSRLQQEFEAKSKHSERNSQLESANLFKSQMDRNRFENNSELIKQLQNENVRVKSKIEEITKDFQLKMENSNRSIEKLKLECRNLQNANDQLESTIKEIDKGKQILQKKYDDVKRHSIQPERDLVRLQQSVEELRNELEYWKSKSNGNPQNRNDEFQAQIKRDKKEMKSTLNAVLMENNRLNSRINSKKKHSKANEKSNYPHKSNQTKSEAPIKINYSEDHNKRFMKENDNLERIESNRIGRSRSNLEVERRDRRSFGSESNMSNVTPYNYQNNNILRDPIGFENPKGFCFLNCVIQQLYSCTEFKDDLIQYHRGDSIATDQSNPQASDDDKIFVNNFSKLMEEIDNRNDRKIRELVSEIQKYFIESSSGDDVLKCFMTVLTILSNVTKVKILNRNNSIQYINPEVSFENFKNQNNGFVFKSFYGQMALRLVCVHCKYSVNTSYQLFKSVALPVPETRSTIRLDEIINGFLQESPVEMDDKRDCKCPNGSLNFLSITEYTHMPQYLHIYLNRGSFYKNGLKNNIHVTCGQVLNFPMKDTSLKYKLISVIDHIGDTLGGHYYAKSCFETDQWWMLNDSTVYRIYGDEKIATENTIVFLFKKFT